MTPARLTISLTAGYNALTLEKKGGSNMPVWVVHAGAHGEFEQFAIDNAVVGIDFHLPQGVTQYPSREALRQHTESSSAANQLWRFAHDLQVGETVVLPCKLSRLVAVGKVAGDYRYAADWQFPHIRPVKWDAVDLPRASFDQDLLYSFGGMLTVFQVNRTNAQERIDAVVRQHLGGTAEESVMPPEVTDDAAAVVNWDELISDYVAQRIRQKFTGHRLEYLVESILKAEGYTTLQTRRGADGGVDVVAGKGQMGFGEPRLCVQVKSGVSPANVETYRSLQATLHNIGASHGLLVSLSDFTREVRNENERSFFQIRLWGAGELTQNLLAIYDQLPADIRADIPLADRKVLMETEA